MNQSLSSFSLTIQCAANNALRCSKTPKETPLRDVRGEAPNSRIKAPLLCATHLKKVDENFNLLTALVRRRRRVTPLSRNRLAALPEKDSLLQSFRQAFFKRPRTPLAAYPSCRVLLLRVLLLRVPRVSFVPYFSRAPKPALSAHLAAVLPAGVTIDESLSH